MATSAEGNGVSGSRGRLIRSGSGTVAPLNTPTRRFYGSHDQIDHRQAGIPNPNVYLVHPFKNASLPKDLVYSKKNHPDPGEQLLSSTVQLIEHFTSCYESLKTQLQDERIKARENMLISRMVNNSSTNMRFSRMTYQRPSKQARLQPLMIRPTGQHYSHPTIEQCEGILPVPTVRSDDLSKIYQDKIRQLKILRPELFDDQGNIKTRSLHRTHSLSQVSAVSSKKSIDSSFRTPHNTLFSAENTHFDDRRTFLTEFTNEDEDNEQNSEQRKTTLDHTHNENPVNQFMNQNYVIKVLEIKTISTPSGNRDRIKSVSDQTNHSDGQRN